VSSWNSANTGNEGRIYWDGQLAAYRSYEGLTYFDHEDPLGTERIRTNYAGSTASTYLSLPWGDGYSSTVNNAGGDQDNLHFAGLERDAESGTEHAQFRNYASVQGRWLGPDSYMGSYDLTNPQSMNRYAYVLNNPLSFTDPLGLDPPNCDADDTVCVNGTVDCSGCWDLGGGVARQPNSRLPEEPAGHGPRKAPSKALCNSLDPPAGPINYSTSASSNAQMGLLGWYQAFKGGGSQDFKGNSAFGSPANQVAAGNFNFGAPVAAKGWGLSTAMGLAGAGAFLSNVNTQAGYTFSQAGYMQGQYGGPSSPNPGAGPQWNMGSGFPGLPSSSGDQGDQEAPNENQAVINGYVWYAIGCHS
jgi:RHS repeat-associated protein